MKRLFCALFVMLTIGPLVAGIELYVCDPNTLEVIDLPLVAAGQDPNTGESIWLPDVMTGTCVSIVIHSDANDLWSGGVFIGGNDRARGQLTARRSDPNTGNWDQSCLPNAGQEAYLWGWKDSNIWGFDCYTDDLQRQTGNWFILDYTALAPGTCTVGFYDHDGSWTAADPNLSIHFHNTPTRDLKSDGLVNFEDFCLFAAQWNTAYDPNDPNQICTADFSRDGYVGLADVIMFSNYWLCGTPGWKPATPPVIEELPAEPPVMTDVTFRLICDPNGAPFTDPNSLSDANSLSEITLEVGDSVIIYVSKSSSVENVRVMDMDVLVSDPNLGAIDVSSGEILIWPRMEMFDYVGVPDQGSGIGFFAANLDRIADGDLACFVYTAQQQGTVTLNLVNYSAAPAANLEPILIHQVVPVVEMLQQAYDESPDLQQSVTQEKWDAFIDSVKESTQTSN